MLGSFSQLGMLLDTVINTLQQFPFEFFIFISSEQCTHAVNFKKLNQYVQTLKKITSHLQCPKSKARFSILDLFICNPRYLYNLLITLSFQLGLIMNGYPLSLRTTSTYTPGVHHTLLDTHKYKILC